MLKMTALINLICPPSNEIYLKKKGIYVQIYTRYPIILEAIRISKIYRGSCLEILKNQKFRFSHICYSE